MLPFAIFAFLFAVLIFFGASLGSLGTGAMLFAAGFVVLGGIAAVAFVRSKKQTVF
jgi:hypothetical protein